MSRLRNRILATLASGAVLLTLNLTAGAADVTIGGAGVNGKASATTGSTTRASASIGAPSGTNGTATASIDGVGGSNNAAASLGTGGTNGTATASIGGVGGSNSVGVNVGAGNTGLGIGATLGPSGTNIAIPTAPGTVSGNAIGLGSVGGAGATRLSSRLAGLSNAEVARYKRRCAEILANLSSYDHDLVGLCQMLH